MKKALKITAIAALVAAPIVAYVYNKKKVWFWPEKMSLKSGSNEEKNVQAQNIDLDILNLGETQ